MMLPKTLLEGHAVRLHPFTAEDVPELVRFDRDNGTTRLHLSNIAVPDGPDTWQRRIDRMASDPGCHAFGIRRLMDDVLVGEATLSGTSINHRHAGLGLLVAREFRGQGLGTEALRLLLAFAFDELNLHRVELGVFSYNVRAIQLYERVGFQHEGRAREWGRRDGAWFDLVNLAILEREWRSVAQDFE
jgi:RimJ/RimL family protein N-acetyltransferase